MTTDNWVSVKERLPDEGKEYLTYNYETDVYDVIYFNDNEKTWCYLGEKPRHVTHWQPLPEPPKE